MRLWRICRQAFADLSGEGPRRYGGRWNTPGRALVYTAESAALAVLEVRVHLDLTWDVLPDDFVLMEIETEGTAIETAASVTDERPFGDAWLKELRSPLLRVPSAIVPESSYVLINPGHPAAAAIHVASTQRFTFDPRLWLPQI